MISNDSYTPDTLAAEVGSIVAEAQSRITGIGAEQYHEEAKPQKFETMEVEGLIAYMMEELLDQINYSVMNLIRLRRIEAAYGVLRENTILSNIHKLEQAFNGK